MLIQTYIFLTTNEFVSMCEEIRIKRDVTRRKMVNSTIREGMYIVHKPNIMLKEKVHQQQYNGFVHFTLDEV
jgi:hypothetical protein